MSDDSDDDPTPRHTPAPSDLFMAVWQAKLFSTGRITMDAADLVHWSKVWISCCDLAAHLETMEHNAAVAQKNDPMPWPPQG